MLSANRSDRVMVCPARASDALAAVVLDVMLACVILGGVKSVHFVGRC